MKKILLLSLVILTASLAIDAQNPDKITAEFTARHRAMDEAEDKKDIAVLERILAEDFIFIAGNGAVNDKKKFLQDTKSNAPSPSGQKLEYEDFKVRMYGKTTGLVNYVASFPGKNDSGLPVTIRYRMSVLWVKQGRDWQIVNFHATRVRP